MCSTTSIFMLLFKTGDLSLPKKRILFEIENTRILVIVLPCLNSFSPVTQIQFVSLFLYISEQEAKKTEW